MLAAKAVEMQKTGMSYRQIGDALGITPAMVSHLCIALDYDPAVYHIETIVSMLAEGSPLYAALAACGMTAGSTQKYRVVRLLRERGIYYRRQGAKSIKREPDTRPRCLNCQILLEPYDPDDAEQQSWQNGTRDGLHCLKCESIINAGGGWLGRLPLLSIEDAEVNVGEALRYA